MNRALCDTSMKLCTVVLDTKRNILKMGGSLDLCCDGHSGHFKKWPPEKFITLTIVYMITYFFMKSSIKLCIHIEY